MVVTRFAPSPTGYLHIGGLRTALFNWLWARHNNGKFILRIEDTDLARNSEEATKAILEAFDWVGLDYDGEVAYQSKRFDIYKRYIQKLLDEGKAYYCYMTKEELDKLREEQMQRGERPRYDRRYRDFTGTLPEGVQPVVRIKAPLEGDIIFEDGIKGTITIKSEELDDFIIARSDGTPTYNFVVAIDDALMGVTDVIRGDDHLYNTPKQIIVYEALGLKIPKFYHVPMILNEQGKKLSKRDGAMDVMEYKRMGYLPEALLNFLVRLGWSHGDQEIFSLEEMIELFDPKDINKSASAYNLSKLQWLNAHYIKNTPNEKLVTLLEDFGIFLADHDKKEILLDALKERAKTLQELADMAKEILEEPEEYDAKGMKKALRGEWREILELFVQKLEQKDVHLPVDFHTIIEEVVKEKEIGFGKIGQPLRLALLGKMAGPDLADVMAIIGKDQTIKRVKKLLESYK
ncbi:glutamate--tRNA ligase [Nitratiruptor tergarcus]|uniref:Glutamate--tRNA ligase n=1 Tax=Nitratiruptor tergarcus DSM 16512 TaxID=1069081 RepID=A0A1W1WQJ0_9BACT|nr:glutamate--tRNA ligase [Nitratiruptor tergarcus]SMC08492.1 glutamyl-tRNA synthetase [Nitratiruptor tergarcus DSM 16512]